MHAYAEDPLDRRVAVGEIIKPWLILGPFYEDFSATVDGLTLFERVGAQVGKTSMEEVVVQARPILGTSPREGEKMRFRDFVAPWSLVRRPEEYLSWGTYNLFNQLGAAFLTTLVAPDKAGIHQWCLSSGISLRAIIAVNGEIVYDSDAEKASAAQRVNYEYGVFAHPFEAVLELADNVVTIALFRLGRLAQVGFRLELLDGDAHVHVPLGDTPSEARRREIEAEVRGLRLARDVFYPHHPIGVTFTEAPKGPVQVDLLTVAGKLVTSVLPSKAILNTGQGFALLCPAEHLPDGAYQIRCTWMAAMDATVGEGDSVTATTFEIRKVTPVAAVGGYDRIDERRKRVLVHYARGQERQSVWPQLYHEILDDPKTDYAHSQSRRPIWPQVARYALLRQGLADALAVDEDAIRETCEFVAARKDCADFLIQGILRLMTWEREERRLSPEINAMMKDTVLGFKYWVDEPGDTVMYMDSENHRFLFHVAEWMAGQLFSTEEFTNSRQTGLYHATKGRLYIVEWLRQRGRFGFDEWHSNSYFPIDIAPLLNVYDFAISEDCKLRQMAGTILDYIFFDLAADAFRGVFGTTHGRSYGIYLKYPDFEGTASTCWLLYGTGALTTETSGMAPVCLATSDYCVPEILYKIANDDQAVVDARIRQGILKGTAAHADFCVYRTPDYMLSGLQDHRQGEKEPSAHVAQVTLGQKRGEQPAVIFWSCPLSSGEGSGLRPDYWSGHIALPRVVQQRNVLALTWRLPRYAWMTHCFFEPVRFDEIRFEPAGGDTWAFARVGEGYVGIYSTNGMAWGAQGQYAGRELVCAARENTWLVECGRAADWGSFDVFMTALKSSQIECAGRILTYHSPSLGEFVTGWDVVPTIDGDPIVLSGYPMVDSEWAYADFGSGEMRICYGDQANEGHCYDLWFNH